MFRSAVLVVLLGGGLTLVAPAAAVAQSGEMCPCGCGMKLANCNMAQCKAKQRLAAQPSPPPARRPVTPAPGPSSPKLGWDNNARATSPPAPTSVGFGYDPNAKLSVGTKTPPVTGPAALENHGRDNRDHISAVVSDYFAARGREFRVPPDGGGYREDSPAHRRGAIDLNDALASLTPAQRQADARGLSAALGPGYTVIVEEVGPSGLQTDTVYRNGQRFTVPKTKNQTATGTHIHIQPDPSVQPDASGLWTPRLP